MSEYFSCPQCGATRENQCACINSLCPDFEGCRACEGDGVVRRICAACNGSGEGVADRTRCIACNGSGVEERTCECKL